MVITDDTTHLDHAHHRVTLVPRGDLDAGSLGAFADSVQAALRSGAHELDVDLAHVPFMDTEALRVLELAQDCLEQVEGHLCLRNPTPPVERLLGLTAFG